MSALTEKRKREIMELLRRTRVPTRIFLNIYFDMSRFYEIRSILRHIREELENIPGIDLPSTHYEGTNMITVTAQWTESEARLRVAEIMNIEGVIDVKANIIGHGFSGPRVSP
jgi:hypothetical protein